MSNVFQHGLTPQRKYLLAQTRARISRETLRTADLQLSLLHFREMKLDDWLFESGSSIAHGTRDQGIFWSWGLNVWATHLYYEFFDKDELDVSFLPLDVFNTIYQLIEDRPIAQLEDELSDIYPSGVLKEELLATLSYLYSPKKERGDNSVFVQLVSKGGNQKEDLMLVERLVRYCEPLALQIPPSPIDDVIDAIGGGFRQAGIGRRAFNKRERIYLQLHVLVCFHNVLIKLRRDLFKAITRIDAPDRQAMLSVSGMDDTLALDIAFYHRNDHGDLEQEDLRSPNRFERFRSPLMSTTLSVEKYLLESDLNIRCCLYNHPLEVRKWKGAPVLVALQRENAEFRPTRYRTGPQNY